MRSLALVSVLAAACGPRTPAPAAAAPAAAPVAAAAPTAAVAPPPLSTARHPVDLRWVDRVPARLRAAAVTLVDAVLRDDCPTALAMASEPFEAYPGSVSLAALTAWCAASVGDWATRADVCDGSSQGDHVVVVCGETRDWDSSDYQVSFCLAERDGEVRWTCVEAGG